MADDNLSPPGEPVVTTPPTETQLVEDISNLLDDPETDPAEETKDSEAAAPDDTEEDDPLGLDDDAEDVETDDDSEDNDGSEDPEVKGGRFAPDSAKVKLDNGETITIADLKVRVDKRVKDFQRDYTDKSTALKAKETEVSQQAQSLAEFRDYAAWYAEQFLPKRPEPFRGNPSQDPLAYQEYLHAKEQWETHAQAWQQFQNQKQAEEQQKTGETQKQMQERLVSEREALLSAIPVLKDQQKGPAVWSALKAGAIQHYRLTEEEFNSISDHRILVGLRDGLAYRRIKAKAPQVQAQVAQKPVKPGRRAPPQAAESKAKQVRSERLRNSGRFEDGVAALQDFDL